MKLKTILLGSFCLFYSNLQAQQIWPKPQEQKSFSGILKANTFKIKTKIKLDETNSKLLAQLFPTNIKGKSTEINIQSLKDKNLQSGTYRLIINDKSIRIGISDQRSLFYSLQTLEQLIAKNNGKISIPQQEIFDYPDVNVRGTVEGFYGTPWSFNDRISQLRFYGKYKLNTYIYGPKDDPYHSSPHWRDAYPEENAKEIKELIDEAHRNYVDFVWAIHPGKDIKWNKTDSLNLLKKFEKMYGLGVRAFAVFFDDISGEGTNPVKQAGLMNYLHHNFIKKYKDMQALILCPTEYNKSWANPNPGTYLDILGEQLDPSIKVMWTGNSVVSDIDMPTMEWINKRIKRKAFIWWNFPVSDYVRNHLLMGPVYGNALDIKNEISGFVSNPMERAEASKIAIFGVADYTWNMRNFNSEQSFNQAIKEIMPEAAASFKLFAENNSDLGANGHSYRRTETVRMLPVIQNLENSLKNTINFTLLNQVQNYYDSIAHAPAEIIEKAKNRNLITEIKPWLEQFELLGKTGVAVTEAYRTINSTNKTQQWNQYLRINRLLLEMKKIDEGGNQNPYQPGVKTGSLILYPFVLKAFDTFGTKILGNELISTNIVKAEQVITNLIQLEKQPIIATDKSIAISPVFEPINLPSKSYFGFTWSDNRIAQQLNFNLDNKDIDKWLVIETSKDGKNWQKSLAKILANTKSIKLEEGINAIRFINESDANQQIYLKQFAVQTKENTESKSAVLMKDNSLKTYTILSPKEKISLNINLKSNVEIWMDTDARLVEIVNEKDKKIVETTENYINIDRELLKNSNSLILQNKGNTPIKIYEIR